jgi:hypothetical protein
MKPWARQARPASLLLIAGCHSGLHNGNSFFSRFDDPDCAPIKGMPHCLRFRAADKGHAVERCHRAANRRKTPTAVG